MKKNGGVEGAGGGEGGEGGGRDVDAGEDARRAVEAGGKGGDGARGNGHGTSNVTCRRLVGSLDLTAPSALIGPGAGPLPYTGNGLLFAI